MLKTGDVPWFVGESPVLDLLLPNARFEGSGNSASSVDLGHRRSVQLRLAKPSQMPKDQWIERRVALTTVYLCLVVGTDWISAGITAGPPL